MYILHTFSNPEIMYHFNCVCLYAIKEKDYTKNVAEHLRKLLSIIFIAQVLTTACLMISSILQEKNSTNCVPSFPF